MRRSGPPSPASRRVLPGASRPGLTKTQGSPMRTVAWRSARAWSAACDPGVRSRSRPRAGPAPRALPARRSNAAASRTHPQIALATAAACPHSTERRAAGSCGFAPSLMVRERGRVAVASRLAARRSPDRRPCARPVMGTRPRARSRPSRRGGESRGSRANRHSRSARAPGRRARECLTSRRSWRRSRSAHTSVGARRGPARASTAATIAVCSAGSGARRGPRRRHPRSARRTTRRLRVSALGRACLLAGRVVQVRLDCRGRLVEQPRDLGDRPALVAVVLRLRHLAPAPHAAVLGMSTRCASLPLARSRGHLVHSVQLAGQHGRPHSFWPDRPLTACRLTAPARRP